MRFVVQEMFHTVRGHIVCLLLIASLSVETPCVCVGSLSTLICWNDKTSKVVVIKVFTYHGTSAKDINTDKLLVLLPRSNNTPQVLQLGGLCLWSVLRPKSIVRVRVGWVANLLVGP